MSLIVLMMVGCPPFHDSTRRARAYHQYFDAPNEETLRELEEAKSLDRRDEKIFECVMAGVLGVSFFAFIRAGKNIHGDERKQLPQ
jgi:ABC-type uncharacterized transport system substrate-binding protein